MHRANKTFWKAIENPGTFQIIFGHIEDWKRSPVSHYDQSEYDQSMVEANTIKVRIFKFFRSALHLALNFFFVLILLI